MKRISVRLLVAALLILVAGLVYRAVSRRGGVPIASGALEGGNLLLVTIDTLRVDRLGCYGSEAGLTPTLDRLAREGVLFERAFAHAPLTLPSHTSIFTGQYPLRHGVHDNGTFRVRDSQTTLATTLKSASYRTAAFVGSFVLDARFGLGRGFDLYDDYYGEKRAFQHFDLVERPAEAVLAPAGRWIGEAAPGSPWFVWVHLWDPHTPYNAPGTVPAASPGDRYDLEVAYVDRTLGAFLEQLDAAGKLNRTLVVVTGDHGESLGDHGEKTHGTFAYNSTLRIPWLMWARDTLRPSVFPELVRQVDLLPTVLDLLGLPASAAAEGADGQSLRPFLAGERKYQAPSSYFEALNTHLTRNWAPLRGVMEEGHKLIDLPIPELYDLESDPRERQNLHQREAVTARKLRETLSELTQGREVLSPRAPDRKTLERLRSLGYVTAPASNRTSAHGADSDPKRLIEVSNLYDEAVERFGDGDVEGALRVLRELVAKQPDSSQAHQELAYVLYQSRQLPEAIGVLEGALRNGVQDASLLGLLGAYLLEAGDARRVVELLEDVVRRDPAYAEAHNYLGIAYSRLGRFEDATREYQLLLELDPSSASAHNNLGSLALTRGDVGAAIKHFESALAFDPDHASTHNGLGVAHARNGNFEEAIESWRRAVELDSRQYDALYNLAVALYDRSPREAAPYLEQFARDAPRDRYRADIAKVREMLERAPLSQSGRW